MSRFRQWWREFWLMAQMREMARYNAAQIAKRKRRGPSV